MATSFAYKMPFAYKFDSLPINSACNIVARGFDKQSSQLFYPFLISDDALLA